MPDGGPTLEDAVDDGDRTGPAQSGLEDVAVRGRRQVVGVEDGARVVDGERQCEEDDDGVHVVRCSACRRRPGPSWRPCRPSPRARHDHPGRRGRGRPAASGRPGSRGSRRQCGSVEHVRDVGVDAVAGHMRDGREGAARRLAELRGGPVGRDRAGVADAPVVGRRRVVPAARDQRQPALRGLRQRPGERDDCGRDGSRRPWPRAASAPGRQDGSRP